MKLRPLVWTGQVSEYSITAKTPIGNIQISHFPAIGGRPEITSIWPSWHSYGPISANGIEDAKRRAWVVYQKHAMRHIAELVEFDGE